MQAEGLIAGFIASQSFETYLEDPMLRSAVERQFEIIGEALSKLARLDPESVAQIPEYKRIIAFRNILIHGYADVDHRLVWDIAKTKLPSLGQHVRALLDMQ